MRTTLILGAGASHDFGYPLGVGLKNSILTDISPGRWLEIELAAAGNSKEDIAAFAYKFRHAHFATIDEFLQAKPKDSPLRKIGKQAIALCISKCEDEGSLFDPSTHWYHRFMDFLRKNQNYIIDQHFSFFTFNYDRSFEHYIHEAITSSYDNLSEVVQKRFLHETNMIHVHGNVGYLPWQNIPQGLAQRGYGKHIQSSDIPSIGENILLPDESESLTAELAQKIQESEVILFVGFGFHSANCDRIFLNKSGIGHDSKKKIYVSVVALAEDKRRMLKEMPSVRLIEASADHFISTYLQRLETGTLDEWGEDEAQQQARRNKNFARILERT